MPKPPSNGSDEPEFGWLYGGRGDAEPQPKPTPDGTRIISRDDLREFQRTGKKPGKASGREPKQPRQPRQPRAPRQARQPRQGKRRFGPKRIILTLLVLWVVFLVAVPIFAWQRINRVEVETAGGPGDQPGTNYLLVGSDSRRGLSKEENKRLGTGGVGDVGQRTDTIMILHTGRGKPLLMSIPRDSLVSIPGHGTTKINAAFAYGGAKLLIETIEKNTGLHIDNYIEIGFGGFVNAVDAVGGVTVCPEKRMVDPKANLRIRKGCQEVNGITALGYARSRHSMADGDLGRARHQREVLAGVGKKVKSPWTILNPFRYWSLNQAMATSITIGKGTSPMALGGFALGMTRVSGSGGLTCAVPIRDLAVHWDTSRARQMFELIKEDRTDSITKRLCTPGGLPQ